MCVCVRGVCETDFHVNYNSVKCAASSLTTTFVYQLNQSVVVSASRVAGGGGPHRRSAAAATSHDGGGGRLDGACASVQAFDEGSDDCLRESSLLFLLLMLGTVWLGLSLYNFTRTYATYWAYLAASSTVVDENEN